MVEINVLKQSERQVVEKLSDGRSGSPPSTPWPPSPSASPNCTRCTPREVPAKGWQLQYKTVKPLFLGGAVADFDHEIFISLRGAVDPWTYGNMISPATLFSLINVRWRHFLWRVLIMEAKCTLSCGLIHHVTLNTINTRCTALQCNC